MRASDERDPSQLPSDHDPETAVQEQPLVDERLPELPEEFTELQMIKAVHPLMFPDQAALLRERFEEFLKAGFTEDQALQLILRWGLKKNLTDS